MATWTALAGTQMQQRYLQESYINSKTVVRFAKSRLCMMLVEHLVLEWVPALCLLRLAVAVKFTIALKTRFYSLPICSLFPFPVFHTVLLDDAQNCLHFTPLAWDCTVLFVVQQRRILIDVACYCDASYAAWIARFSAFSVVKCKQVLLSRFVYFPVLT